VATRLNRAQLSAVKEVRDDIVPLSKSSPYVRALLYGRNGKGKTRAAANAPKPLVLDVNEEGTQSITGYDGDYYPIKRWEQFIWAYWYLRTGKHGYETAVIDTMSQVQKLAMRSVLNEAEDRDPNRPPNFPTQREWGQMTELVRPWIFAYRNLPMHIIFVCQERVDRPRDEGEETGEIRPHVVPDLSPGLRADVMSAVGIIGRCYRRGRRVGRGKKETIEWETRCLVGDHEDYETKDRTGQLGYVVRDPSTYKFIEAWRNSPPEEE